MLKSVEDGAKNLLKDTIQVLSKFPNIEYIIIGGWCPVIRNKSCINHPGTLDVDILFRSANVHNSLSEIIEELIQSDFHPSAKHPFQLLKKQCINGKDLIYNIDLLHPSMLEDENNIGLFVDHLELDIPLNNNEQEMKSMCSIVLPNSDVLFQKKMYSNEKIDKQNLPLVSFEGMFITKIDSCQKRKRERDCFDIYIAFINDGINKQSLINIANEDIRVNKSLNTFRQYLKDNHELFDKNVKYFAKEIEESPAKFILSKIGSS